MVKNRNLANLDLINSTNLRVFEVCLDGFPSLMIQGRLRRLKNYVTEVDYRIVASTTILKKKASLTFEVVNYTLLHGSFEYLVSYTLAWSVVAAAMYNRPGH